MSHKIILNSYSYVMEKCIDVIGRISETKPELSFASLIDDKFDRGSPLKVLAGFPLFFS